MKEHKFLSFSVERRHDVISFGNRGSIFVRKGRSMTEVQNEGNSVRLSGRSIQSGGSERGMVGGRSRFFENGCCRCRRDTGARTRPQLGGPGVDEQRRGRALCKADFKFRCGPPCPHTSTHPCVGKEARDCTQFRLQEEHGHTDGRRHASGFVQSVGRAALLLFHVC